MMTSSPDFLDQILVRRMTSDFLIPLRLFFRIEVSQTALLRYRSRAIAYLHIFAKAAVRSTQFKPRHIRKICKINILRAGLRRKDGWWRKNRIFLAWLCIIATELLKYRINAKSLFLAMRE